MGNNNPFFSFSSHTPSPLKQGQCLKLAKRMIRHGKIENAAIALIVLNTFSLVFVSAAPEVEDEDDDELVEKLEDKIRDLEDEKNKIKEELDETKRKIKATEIKIKDKESAIRVIKDDIQEKCTADNLKKYKENKEK